MITLEAPHALAVNIHTKPIGPVGYTEHMSLPALDHIPAPHTSTLLPRHTPAL